MGFIARSTTSVLKKISNVGNVIVSTLRAHADDDLTSEIYQAPGYFANPPKNTVLFLVPVDGNTGQLIGVAQNNYQIKIDNKSGEAGGYSTNELGDVIMLRERFSNSGKYSLANDSEDLKTLITDLISTIRNITINPTTFTLQPTSIAELEILTLRFSVLLEELN